MSEITLLKNLNKLNKMSKVKKLKNFRRVIKGITAAAGTATAILGGAYAAYKYVFHFVDNRVEAEIEPPTGEQYDAVYERMYALVKELLAIPYEQVYITSFDGKKLAGKYYHVSDDAPLQIEFHGYHGSGIRDFCGGNKIAREMGHNTLLIDQRAHGKSEGHTLSFGVLERYDCVSWIKYANERFGADKPIFLAGVSMGAATVLMASELKLPENVIGIIADCSYTTPDAIICKVGRDMKLPTRLIYPFIWLGAQVYGKFQIRKSSPVEAVKHTDIPILIIHGEDDRLVPYEMGKEIYEACASEKMMLSVPGAGHAISYLVDEEAYTRETEAFVNRQLEKW